MSKISIEFHQCDICEMKTNDKYIPDNWQTYYYARSWQGGRHIRKHEEEFLACRNCRDSKSVFKKILRYLIKEPT